MNLEEKNTKELELGKDTSSDTTQQPKEEPKPEAKVENSFYEGGSNKKEKTSWLKDWRGKTLFLVIAILIVLAISIPSGMAIAGYFSDKHEVPPLGNNETEKRIENDINNIADESVVRNLDYMHNQNFFQDKEYKNLKTDAEDHANNSIKDEKDSLKSQYGNTWENEWAKSLEDKGFYGSLDQQEEQYKNKLMSDEFISKEKSKLTYDTYVYDYHQTDDADITNKYQSTGTSTSGRSKFIMNRDQVENKLQRHGNVTSAEYIISPEDVVSAYLYIYEPILFNSTLLGFTPDKNGESSLEATNVTVTKDQLKNIWVVQKAIADGVFVPSTPNDSGIMSKTNVTLPTEVKAAIYSSEAGLASTGDALAGLFGVVSTFENKSDIDSLLTSEVEAKGKEIYDAIKGKYISDGTTPLVSVGAKETLGTEDYYTLMTTEGIKFVGITDEGEDLVNHWLSISNGSSDKDDYVNSDFGNVWKTWYNENFKYIVLANEYRVNPTEINKHINEVGLGTVEDYKQSIIDQYETKYITNASNTFKDINNYYSDNRLTYDFKQFHETNSALVQAKLFEGNVWTLFNGGSSAMDFTNNKVIIKGGHNE